MLFKPLLMSHPFNSVVKTSSLAKFKVKGREILLHSYIAKGMDTGGGKELGLLMQFIKSTEP